LPPTLFAVKTILADDQNETIPYIILFKKIIQPDLNEIPAKKV